MKNTSVNSRGKIIEECEKGKEQIISSIAKLSEIDKMSAGRVTAVQDSRSSSPRLPSDKIGTESNESNNQARL